MDTFINFLEECKRDLNHHQQNVKESFEEGWLPLFTHFRSTGTLPIKPSTKHIVLNGLTEYNLTDEEAFFILAHTGSYSSWINQPLRNGQLLDSICKEKFAENLDKSLNKLPPFNCENVFRMDDSPLGTAQEICSWFKKNIGKVIIIPYFLSTSKENWDNTEITWKIKTMQANSNARDLQLITNNDIEKEVLFKRYSSFKIISVNENTGIIEMEETSNSNSSISLTGLYFEK
jgi:hypothetical protein